MVRIIAWPAPQDAGLLPFYHSAGFEKLNGQYSPEFGCWHIR
jgi:hypothetical protein